MKRQLLGLILLAAGLLCAEEPAATAATRLEFKGKQPGAFGTSVLAGKPVSVKLSGDACFIQNGKWHEADGILTLTDEKFEGDNFVSGSYDGSVLYTCTTPISGLKRFRVTVRIDDPARARCILTPVGLSGGEWKDLAAASRNDAQDYSLENHLSYLTFEYVFPAGSVPEKLDGIGFRDESRKEGYYWPRYAQMEAE